MMAKFKVVPQILVCLKKCNRKIQFKSISQTVFQGDVLVAQAAVFFTAGYETSSSVMSFALYELCWKVTVFASKGKQ